jgi:uncharacterized protein with ParB-like and HNH nuclease domain
MANEITCEKVFVGKVFGDMWFSIPAYQRPYVWGKDQVTDLLDDVVAAMRSSDTDEYFIGSLVIRPVETLDDTQKAYTENELLDGQQRLTTLLLIFAALRDLTEDDDYRTTCADAIFMKGSKAKNIPERMRINFQIRDAAQEFLENLKEHGKTEALAAEDDEEIADISVRNMANTLFEIREFVEEQDVDVDALIGYLWQKVSLIYVSTEQLSDAIRLFNVLNNRGIPLRNSDILKSINLDVVSSEKEKAKYALMWEETENALGDEFDRFLGHIRTMLVKEKARTGLLQEFEEKIYKPRTKKSSVLLEKGKATFDMVGRHRKHFETLFSNENFKPDFQHQLDNLIFIMSEGFPSTDWIPPMLMYFDKFGFERLLEFLECLDNRFSSDWIQGYTPTERIEEMNDLLKKIEAADTPDEVFEYENLYLDEDEWDELLAVIDGKVYGKRFARYLLLKLNYLNGNKSQKMYFSRMSIEHVLPQNPKEGSTWLSDFDDDDRSVLTHKIGNLVIIGRAKNSSLSNADFPKKMDRYLKSSLETIPHTLKVLNGKKAWASDDITANQAAALSQLKDHYLAE